MGNQPGGQGRRVPPPPHFRNTDAADGRGRSRARPAQGGENAASDHIGNTEAYRDLVEPFVKGFVKILAGMGGGNRRTQQNKKRDGRKRKAVHAAVEHKGQSWLTVVGCFYICNGESIRKKR
ncbi:MAG: hypothetical protein PVI45_10525, partial [Desulfobacterales bacterium]